MIMVLQAKFLTWLDHNLLNQEAVALDDVLVISPWTMNQGMQPLFVSALLFQPIDSH